MRRYVVPLALLLVASSAFGTGRRRSVRHPSAPAAAVAVATADSYSADHGTPLTIAAPGVLANDVLNGAVLAGFGAVSGTEQSVLGNTASTAQGGTVSLSAAGGFTYTPATAFSGIDTFKYMLSNAGGTSSATVSIDVRAAVLSAASDTYATPPEIALFVPAPGVLTNDTLAGGRIVSYGARNGTEQTALSMSAPTSQGGVITISADGSFSYNTPPTIDDGYGYSLKFAGLDTFFYVIQSGSVKSTAVVNVAVEEPPTDADYAVTSPGHFYAISSRSGENPVLELKRGQTYSFQINVSPAHPFAILDAPPGTVTNNNITSGRLTFSVPAGAGTYRYRCSSHGFGNVINTVP
jgi:plastocyanin